MVNIQIAFNVLFLLSKQLIIYLCSHFYDPVLYLFFYNVTNSFRNYLLLFFYITAEKSWTLKISLGTLFNTAWYTQILQIRLYCIYSVLEKQKLTGNGAYSYIQRSITSHLFRHLLDVAKMSSRENKWMNWIC